MLIKQYEDENYPITIPDRIDAIKLIMAKRGFKNKDLAGKIGFKGYVSASLNKKEASYYSYCEVFLIVHSESLRAFYYPD